MTVPMPSLEPGRRALPHLDTALAARPEKNGHELSAALRELAELRDGFVAVRRREPDHPAVGLLAPVNGVISSVLAAQFPIGEVQWEALVKARDWLAGVVEAGYLER